MNLEDFIRKVILNFNFIESLYECIRLVDPIKKEVFQGIKPVTELGAVVDNTCYSQWRRNKICDNCISIRAYNQDKPFTKIEYNNEDLYVVTAVPLKQHNMVVELLQNVSSEYFTHHDKNFNDIIRMIQKQNLSVVKNILTNIYHEQFIFERLPHDIMTSYQQNINIALFMIKIKDMAITNNKYGYSVGDRIIEEVGKAVKSLTRHTNDWISSYGGVRYVLLMYDINENQVGRICNTIYDRVSAIHLFVDEQEIPIEIGVGYHILKDKLISPEQFLEKAKDMLKTESRLDGNESALKRITVKYSFTYREKEIALLLLQGKSNIDIADNLYIGLSTVKKHISALFNKMDVRSRTELIAKLNKDADV
jgi:two-component system, cell cycle response regulator